MERGKAAFYDLLALPVRERLGELPDDLTEVRLRAGRPAELVCMERGELRGAAVPVELIQSTADRLAMHSLYAREEELRQGFFTIMGGCRVGVCGRMSMNADGLPVMTHISSLCIRIARQIRGAADGVMEALYENGRPVSALILSPPALGKTTMLRDIARQMSDSGVRVAIADERGELAGCVQGVPTLDVGLRTDVMDGCPKRIAMNLLTRTMSPEVIVTDELGQEGDAQAVLDAMRCGVQVIASVHAQDVSSAATRCGGLDIKHFDRLIVLGGGIGQVREVICGRQVKEEIPV